MGWFALPSFVLTLLLLIIHTPSYTSSSSVLPLCNHDDSSNLFQFKNSFAVNTSFFEHLWWRWQAEFYCSSYPKTASWNNNTDCCEWDGVTCDTTSGHVIGLDLSCSMLKGELNSNSTLFHLTHLQQLNLAYNDLSASPLSSRIGDLAALTHLNLSNSALGGDIPFTISHLSKLFSLDLSRTETLDEMGYSKLRIDPSTWNKLILNTTNLKELVLDEVNMSSIGESSLSLLMNLSSSLVSLSLRDTKLHGNFPIGILGLPNLQELTLSDNQDLKVELPKSNWSTPLRILYLTDTVFSGEIPDSIGHLKSLNQLSLGSCQFDGLVPLSLWNLTQLTVLGLAENTLHGEIPSLLSNLKHLTVLDLSANNFNGHIPDVFHNLTKLESLSLDSNSLGDLSHNKIDGVIPKWFSRNLLHKWKNIYYIDLSFNRLQGELPIPPNGLQIFSVSNNNFTGTVSSAFCNASSLSALILSHNHLSGLIPQCLGAFLSLSILDLQVNNFHGSIPTNFSQGNQFQTIKLNHNQLEGSIPKSLANCTSLEVLDLAENNIEDVFPSWLETLQELKVLSLRANKFHGTITSLSAEHPFPKLRIFDVSNNKFSGPLPTSFFQNFQGMKDLNDSTHHPPGLSYMTVSSRTTYNDSVVVIIKGHSMELVRILTTFTTIDLSNNMFEGGIPHVIGELSSLKGLNLSYNKISGMIPETLGNLTSLEWLDLSCNQLKGEQFNTFQNDSYKDNPMLCGFPLSKSCGNDEEQPPSVFAEAKESLFGWKSVAVGYGCGVVFGMFLGRLFIKTAKPLWLARLLCGYN
ncbi:Receptor-like protein [Arachis hypogaea]|nr:Receptor-like protein [Arachis hypogaea]